ncbi:class I SAM-dependent methyltransferase [Chryseolinea lacunae]|uniref:Class I SAM-dependent methyltransferase n=1 Tax=Chryseolinea lacunae TaxID=2801331 RepID=A0ABS1KUF1_9BACT|nr:class I SAM-dependent methyltransferase [Chryseolinea lacunae]MBL0743066.1 class I SAM-dependent methyltransferase [Chryseolinea lacunae]
MYQQNNIKAYSAFRASNYDDESKLDKGNREQHRNFLVDLLCSQKNAPTSFLDLGCGTGYFTEVFYEIFPRINGYLVDGSQEMLDIAQDRFLSRQLKAHLHCALFENINWHQMPAKVDVIFSALAIHHLQDADKWKLFQRIYDHLDDGGIFILYDLFKLKDQQGSALLEYLACRDHQRRLQAELDLDELIDELSIENITANDRRIRGEEGDKEAFLDDQLHHLAAAGFKHITTVFQEARFAGTIAYKS